jgi:signal transduction histidine kinase
LTGEAVRPCELPAPAPTLDHRRSTEGEQMDRTLVEARRLVADPPAARLETVPIAAPAASSELRWRDAALEVQDAILSGAEVDVVLELVAGTARRLVDADVATLAVSHVQGQSLILLAADGYRADELRGAVFPIEESLSGQVMISRTPLHVSDASANANAYQPICELGDLGGSLFLPLSRGLEPFGTLLVARRHGRPDFADEDLELLRLFTGHVAVAVEFCRGQEELHRLAHIEEAERIGRELHDTVIQRLFAVGLQLQDAASRVPPDAFELLAAVMDQLDGTVRDIRSTVLTPRTDRSPRDRDDRRPPPR